MTLEFPVQGQVWVPCAGIGLGYMDNPSLGALRPVCHACMRLWNAILFLEKTKQAAGPNSFIGPISLVGAALKF